MNINLLTPDYYKRWDDYVRSHPNGTPYHLTTWKNAIEKAFRVRPYYYYISDGINICGIIPFFFVRTLFSGKKLISIPYSVYGGFFGDNSSIEKYLHDHSVSLFQDSDAEYMELRYFEGPELQVPTQKIYVTYRKKIEKDYEDILRQIPRKSRASIRNGYKKYKLHSVIDRDWNTLFRLYCINKRKLGSPQYPAIFFESLIREFKDNAGICTIYYQNLPVASVLFFIFNDQIFPYFSGSDHRYWYTNANNVLYYELMKYACDQGIDIFDFGRSRINTGSAKFKENMGFIPQPLKYYIYTKNNHTIPNITPSNQKFDVISRIWSRLPLAVTKTVGPMIVKRIP